MVEQSKMRQLILEIHSRLYNVNKLDREINVQIRENVQLKERNDAKNDELDDIREQVEIKQRAPESKKRASEARLDQAMKQFEAEDQDYILQMTMVCATRGWKLL